MTIEEAIKLLHPDTTGEGIMELEYYGGFESKENVIKAIEEACILACEALEKQIPKNPIENLTDDTCLYYENCCPSCENLLVVRYKHCPKCGQRLDYEVEKC